MEFLMANVGYARVSSREQSLDVQLDKLLEFKCEKIFKEKLSGADDRRPKLEECLTYVREGDTLFVTNLDRLARSTLHLCKISAELEAKKVKLHVINQNIDTGTSCGRLLFNMLGVIAEFEKEISAERQAAGIKRARALGKYKGGSYALDRKKRQELCARRESGVLIRVLMKDYGISKACVYRYLKLSKT
jgi:DNA invertase Pin-like site-specific DNA recombinase